GRARPGHPRLALSEARLSDDGRYRGVPQRLSKDPTGAIGWLDSRLPSVPGAGARPAGSTGAGSGLAAAYCGCGCCGGAFGSAWNAAEAGWAGAPWAGLV